MNKIRQQVQEEILPRPLSELLIRILMRTKMEEGTKAGQKPRKRDQRPHL